MRIELTCWCGKYKQSHKEKCYFCSKKSRKQIEKEAMMELAQLISEKNLVGIKSAMKTAEMRIKNYEFEF